ncbi:unnamed protein product [Allacma fusca]|uniref:Tubulin glycylase 3A n=1 Tax=Allacma fusca TaxID=39272 RepID=A0A8J2NYL8_9HEXA|nr:unnamed protein product [Allacma fusca]
MVKNSRFPQNEQSISSLNSLSSQRKSPSRKSLRAKPSARPSVSTKRIPSRKTFTHRGSTPSRSLSSRRASTRRLSSDAEDGSTSRSLVDEKPSQLFRVKYERAVKARKVFWLNPALPPIRHALLTRGWVEKSPNLSIYLPLPKQKSTSTVGVSFGNRNKEAWANRLLDRYPPDFVWTHRASELRWHRLADKQIINIHPNAVFTTKTGITDSIQNSHWIGDHIANILFPRCYRVGNREERSAFIADYRFTACISLLQWVVGAYELHGEDGVFNAQTGVNPNCLDFATIQVSTYVKTRQHEDLDWKFTPTTSKENWQEFLALYQQAVCLERRLAPKNDLEYAQKTYKNCKMSLQTVAPFWSQMNNDGVHNIWICKPGHKSRGFGIVLKNNLDDIMHIFQQHRLDERKNAYEWVVQKYIERPLLIFNTKFDIRQWFLVSDWNPLTVWVYKESYLRFCSQQYTVHDLQPSVHLCNNAIQSNYKNDPERSKILPKENMWDHYTFQAYLKSQDKPDLWDSVIYPGMKKAILGVLLASNEDIMIRKNSFELYGADFMLATDFLPWLIEINAGPSLAYTTSVTQRLCRQVMGDVIKVVIDRREDLNADTGMFELIYKQHRLPSVNNVEMSYTDLFITGKKLNTLRTRLNASNPFSEASLLSRGSSVVKRNSWPPTPTPDQSSSREPLEFVNFMDRLHLQDLVKTSPRTGNSGLPIICESSIDCVVDKIDTKLSHLLGQNPPQRDRSARSSNKNNNTNKDPMRDDVSSKSSNYKASERVKPNSPVEKKSIGKKLEPAKHLPKNNAKADSNTKPVHRPNNSSIPLRKTNTNNKPADSPKPNKGILYSAQGNSSSDAGAAKNQTILNKSRENSHRSNNSAASPTSQKIIGGSNPTHVSFAPMFASNSPAPVRNTILPISFRASNLSRPSYGLDSRLNYLAEFSRRGGMFNYNYAPPMSYLDRVLTDKTRISYKPRSTDSSAGRPLKPSFKILPDKALQELNRNIASIQTKVAENSRVKRALLNETIPVEVLIPAPAPRKVIKDVQPSKASDTKKTQPVTPAPKPNGAKPENKVGNVKGNNAGTSNAKSTAGSAIKPFNFLELVPLKETLI